MTLIFSIPSYEPLAVDLARLTNCARGAVERSEFPDGEHYLRVVSDVRNQHAVIVGGTISDKAMLEIYDLACAIVENGATMLTLVVPWFGYATMDRAVKAGEAVMAKTRARIFSSIPAAGLGNAIVLLDIHSEGIPHYFEGTIRPYHVYGKPVIEPLMREIGGSSFVVGSTDAGRAKWVESLANDLGVLAVFVYKRRLGPEKTEVTAVSSRFEGQNVVIYDDMIRTGTSLINAARAYREAGAGRVSAVATHGVFAGDAWQRIQKCGLFDRVACTDSHPRARELESEGVIVRSCAELFVQQLQR